MKKCFLIILFLFILLGCTPNKQQKLVVPDNLLEKDPRSLLFELPPKNFKYNKLFH